jgi:transposase
MFFRLKKSGQRQYLQIVQNHWDKSMGIPRQQVLATLGRFDHIVDKGSLKSLLASGERFCNELVVLSDYKKGKSKQITTRRIGPVLVFERLWKESGISEILSELLGERFFEFNVEKTIFFSVLHRIMESGSDRNCHKWLREYLADDSDKLKLHHYYRAMNWLGEPLKLAKERDNVIPFSPRCTKDVIEERLFQKKRTLFSDLEVVFFDTTSIYFEGAGGETLGEFGNSKDHRPDRKQLVIGVIIDDKGHPICCEMWPGNTTDVKSLIPIVKRLKKRFKIKEVCIVSDRGMISQAVLNWLESENWPYILGARMRKQKEVKEEVLKRGGRYQTVVDWEEKKNGKSPLKIKEVKVADRRYIVCFNVSQARKEKNDRLEILKNLQEQLKKGGKSLVGNKGYRKYLKSVGKAFEIDANKIKQEARYDGKWVLRTNTNFEARDVALKYKELWMVEQIFRSMKTLLETRPIYHRSDNPIRGHVFCSFLALLLIKELKVRLENKEMKFEWEEILNDLDSLEEIEIEKEERRFLLRSELKGCCGDIFKAVGLAVPPSFRQVERG